MFLLRPELLVTCLFTECLQDDETVLIEGCERYSKSSGYADSFRWEDNFDERQSSGTQR